VRIQLDTQNLQHSHCAPATCAITLKLTVSLFHLSFMNTRNTKLYRKNEQKEDSMTSEPSLNNTKKSDLKVLK
jgi:hypothetical protein